jgi:hypothetical protein
VREGEEARLTPGATSAAEIRSRGALPLRVRREALHHARPAFPGSAVVLGEATFEVIAEDFVDETGGVVYRLRPWPKGEVFRDRVVYGPALVGAIEAERQSARLHTRVRPWRFVLYPFVGLLPEEQQEWACERLGLYSVTATLVSGLVESAGVLSLLALAARAADTGRSIALLLLAPVLVVVFVLPGLGRACGALFFRETGGSPLVLALAGALRAAGALPVRARGIARLTRAEFWSRLAQPDELHSCDDGSVLVRGTLPHVSWDASRRLEAGNDYWRIEPRLPEREGERVVYVYRLVPLADPPEPGAPGPTVPAATAYADETLGGVRCEWDAFNSGFAWLTSMLGSELQSRAFDHRGGPAAVRRATLATAAGSAALAVYLLRFLPGPTGDPLAPLLALAGVLLLVDAGRRVQAARAARYAPSLLRWLLPSDVLRPERLAYHAHRDAECDALGLLERG